MSRSSTAAGRKIFSDEIDITDDFANGFVNALRVETIDKTYFAAESAERNAGTTTTFNNGVYTACEPCEDKPDKAPIWRIKAQKIIWNGKEKTVRFEDSRFEFFGMPIAYFPVMEVPDPTVKRKTGFLIPGVNYNNDLGFGVTVPYYFALSPTYDLTLKDHYYWKQGFLGEAEWRQRFNNGYYSLKAAGINQQDPEAFGVNNEDSGTAADPNHMARHGRFEGRVQHQSALDVRLGRARPVRQGLFEYLQHQRVQPASAPVGGLSDRAHRPQLFQPQRHALRGPGRPPRDQPHRALRQAALGVAVLRLFPHVGRAGSRRRVERSTSTRESLCAKSWTPCRACRWCAASRARTAASPPKPNGRNRSSPRAAW